MMFGRVEAVAVLTDSSADGGQLRITVYLESGRTIVVVRDDLVPTLRPVLSPMDLAWQADQYAQETITNELALEGWEVIGGGEIPEPEPGAVARSAAYGVRRLSTADPE